MAENKKSFILYSNHRSIIDMLSNEQAGQLFKHIFSYVNDEDPVSNDPFINLAFEPIKIQLKMDLKKWEGIKEDKSYAGRLGNLKRWGNNDLHESVVKEEMTLDEAENIAKHRKASHTDKLPSQSIAGIAVNVDVNVNDTNKDTKVSSNSSTEGIDYKLMLKFINETFGREFRVVNKAVKAKYNARLKEGWKKSDIQKAILSVRNDPFHIENDFKYVTLDYFSRDKTLQIHATGKFIPKTKSFDPWS